jgi:hypothetical protein
MVPAGSMTGLHPNATYYPVQVFYYPTGPVSPSIYVPTGHMHPGQMALLLRGLFASMLIAPLIRDSLCFRRDRPIFVDRHIRTTLSPNVSFVSDRAVNLFSNFLSTPFSLYLCRFADTHFIPRRTHSLLFICHLFSLYSHSSCNYVSSISTFVQSSLIFFFLSLKILLHSFIEKNNNKTKLSFIACQRHNESDKEQLWHRSKINSSSLLLLFPRAFLDSSFELKATWLM